MFVLALAFRNIRHGGFAEFGLKLDHAGNQRIGKTAPWKRADSCWQRDGRLNAFRTRRINTALVGVARRCAGEVDTHETDALKVGDGRSVLINSLTSKLVSIRLTMVMSALRSFATNKIACCILAPTIKANGINFIAFTGLSGF